MRLTDHAGGDASKVVMLLADDNEIYPVLNGVIYQHVRGMAEADLRDHRLALVFRDLARRAQQRSEFLFGVPLGTSHFVNRAGGQFGDRPDGHHV